MSMRARYALDRWTVLWTRIPVLAPILALMLAFGAGIGPAPALARDHFVAPLDGPRAAAPDGSQHAPWSSTRAALASEAVTGGDRLRLLPGAHGTLDLAAGDYATPVLIEPFEPGSVQVDRIIIRRGKGLTLRGLQIWPADPAEAKGAHVETASGTARIRFEALDIRGAKDAPERYLAWDLADWKSGPGRRNGMVLQSPDSAVIDSRITGVNFGITLRHGARGTELRGNHVLGFGGDGLRGEVDGMVITGNRIENCIKINDNHDDGFQAWVARKEGAKALQDLTFEQNQILEWTAGYHPLRCRLQGVGLFDGPYRNVMLRNNAIAVTAYHGISVYGGQGVQILHNTVAHSDGRIDAHPWIMMRHGKKDEHPARDLTLAGNIAQDFRIQTEQGKLWDRRANALVRAARQELPGLARGDLRLRSDSPLIDRALPEFAPAQDLRGVPRPQGAAPDFGAFERRSTDP